MLSTAGYSAPGSLHPLHSVPVQYSTKHQQQRLQGALGKFLRPDQTLAPSTPSACTTPTPFDSFIGFIFHPRQPSRSTLLMFTHLLRCKQTHVRFPDRRFIGWGKNGRATPANGVARTHDPTCVVQSVVKCRRHFFSRKLRCENLQKVVKGMDK